MRLGRRYATSGVLVNRRRALARVAGCRTEVGRGRGVGLAQGGGKGSASGTVVTRPSCDSMGQNVSKRKRLWADAGSSNYTYSSGI
jgi:hypothetical protein